MMYHYTTCNGSLAIKVLKMFTKFLRSLKIIKLMRICLEFIFQ